MSVALRLFMIVATDSASFFVSRPEFEIFHFDDYGTFIERKHVNVRV